MTSIKEIFDTIQSKWNTEAYRQMSGYPVDGYFLTSMGLSGGGVSSKSVSVNDGLSRGLKVWYDIRFRYGKIKVRAFAVYTCVGFVLENNYEEVLKEITLDVKSEAGFQREFKKVVTKVRKQSNILVKLYGKRAAENADAKSLYLATC